MAAPTPVTRTDWNGRLGQARWYAAWTDGTQLTDSIVVDVSALSPVPSESIVRIKTVDLYISGDVSVKLEWDDIAVGTCDTRSPAWQVDWVSGDLFVVDWHNPPTSSLGIDEITVNSVVYPIQVVDSTILMTLDSDPGNQTAQDFSIDEFIDRFIGQSNASFHFHRDYADNPNRGLKPRYHASDNYGGDIILTTLNAASGDEIMLDITFER